MKPSHTMQELVILDGTAMLFRAYYSMRYQAPDGMEVGAVMGMTERTLRMMRRLQPSHVAIVFDAGKKTFRNEIDPRYKANRDDPPEDLIPQFALSVEAAQLLGFPVFRVPGFEADDLMATLATLAHGVGARARVCAIDKDLLQLVDDAPPPILVEDPRNNQLLDVAGVRARIGLNPDQLCDYAALVGDSTDNVTGIRGVGPKGAVALLEHFGTIDTMYERLSEVESLPVRGAASLARKLEDGRSDAYLSRTLVRLRRDVSLPFLPEELHEVCHWHGPVATQAESFFTRMGFQGALRGLTRLANNQA